MSVRAEPHVHEPETEMRFSVYRIEVCSCGATRRVDHGREPDKWHTCELCTHAWGRA